MTQLFKNIYFLSFLFILVSCNQEKEQALSLNSLITPDYKYNQDYFYCDLNKNVSLINLESFLSLFIDDHLDDFDEFLDIDILFPDKVEEVKKFIFSVRSIKNPKAVADFVNTLNTNEFEKISSCNFSIHQSNALDIIKQVSKVTDDILNVEILRCTYNAEYNFGTFRISIDRFSNAVGRLKIPYKLSYISLSNSNDFIWVNSFFMNDHEEFLETKWVIDEESTAIKEEFNQNATCLDSEKYKSYVLI